MGKLDSLPFPRGDTLFGLGESGTLSSTQAAECAKLLGKVYEIEDPDYDGERVRLRVVQVSTAFTAAAKLVNFSDTNKNKIDGHAPTAGKFALPLDHKYAGKALRQYDYVYVVEEGKCEATGGATLAAGTPIVAQNDGEFVQSAATDDWGVGVCIDAAADATLSTIHVKWTPGAS